MIEDGMLVLQNKVIAAVNPISLMQRRRMEIEFTVMGLDCTYRRW